MGHCVWPLEAKLMGRGSLRSLRLVARSWSLHGLAVTLTCLLPLPQSHSLGPVWRACRVFGDSPRRSLTREERKGEEEMEEGRTRRLADAVTWSARLCPLWAFLCCPPTPLATAVEQTLGCFGILIIHNLSASLLSSYRKKIKLSGR